MIAPGPLKYVEISDSYGRTFPLWGDAIHFVSLDGVGIPPVMRLTTSSPLQHGLTDRGYRVDQRRMTLQLLLEGTDAAHTDTLRDSLVDIFSPINGALTLKCTREDDEVRWIDCYVDGEMDFPSSRRIGSMQPVSVSLVAPDPAWYSPTQQIATATAEAAGDLSVVIDVQGITWFDYPIVEIAGEVNAEAALEIAPGGRSFLRFWEQGIPPGETWRFDFRPESRSIVRVSDGENKMPVFFSSHVANMADGKILPVKDSRLLSNDITITTNTVRVVRSGADAVEIGASITVYWYKRFLSL